MSRMLAAKLTISTVVLTSIFATSCKRTATTASNTTATFGTCQHKVVPDTEASVYGIHESGRADKADVNVAVALWDMRKKAPLQVKNLKMKIWHVHTAVPQEYRADWLGCMVKVEYIRGGKVLSSIIVPALDTGSFMRYHPNRIIDLSPGAFSALVHGLDLPKEAAQKVTNSPIPLYWGLVGTDNDGGKIRATNLGFTFNEDELAAWKYGLEEGKPLKNCREKANEDAFFVPWDKSCDRQNAYKVASTVKGKPRFARLDGKVAPEEKDDRVLVASNDEPKANDQMQKTNTTKSEPRAAVPRPYVAPKSK